MIESEDDSNKTNLALNKNKIYVYEDIPEDERSRFDKLHDDDSIIKLDIASNQHPSSIN